MRIYTLLLIMSLFGVVLVFANDEWFNEPGEYYVLPDFEVQARDENTMIDIDSLNVVVKGSTNEYTLGYLTYEQLLDVFPTGDFPVFSTNFFQGVSWNRIQYTSLCRSSPGDRPAWEIGFCDHLCGSNYDRRNDDYCDSPRFGGGSSEKSFSDSGIRIFDGTDIISIGADSDSPLKVQTDSGVVGVGLVSTDSELASPARFYYDNVIWALAKVGSIGGSSHETVTCNYELEPRDHTGIGDYSDPFKILLSPPASSYVDWYTMENVILPDVPDLTSGRHHEFLIAYNADGTIRNPSDHSTSNVVNIQATPFVTGSATVEASYGYHLSSEVFYQLRGFYYDTLTHDIFMCRNHLTFQRTGSTKIRPFPDESRVCEGVQYYKEYKNPPGDLSVESTLSIGTADCSDFSEEDYYSCRDFCSDTLDENCEDDSICVAKRTGEVIYVQPRQIR